MHVISLLSTSAQKAPKKKHFHPALYTCHGIRHIKGTTNMGVNFRKSLFINSNVTIQLNFQRTTGVEPLWKHSTINSTINLHFIFHSNNNSSHDL